MEIQGRPTIDLLNEDVVLQIIESLRSRRGKKDLRAFSQTCRWLRSLCIEPLYSSLENDGWNSIRYAEQINERVPQWIRPIVRFLILWDDCELSPAARRVPRWRPTYPLVCDHLDNETFGELVRSMPHLQSLTLAGRDRNQTGRVYGIPWEVLKTAMSIPALQELSLCRHLFCPLASSKDPTFAPPPLTIFRYMVPDIRGGPLSYPAETEALGFVLEKLRGSLVTLALSSNAAPFHVIDGAEWPRLRSFELRGDAPISPGCPPLRSLLEHMPELRSLCLSLMLLEGQGDRLLVYPPDANVSSDAMANLEEITITYPHPRDPLYACLPPSLRHLSLEGFTPYASCVWPRWYRLVYSMTNSAQRQQLILPASELLLVLRRCHTPHLHTLKIEYRVDDAEEELLSHISARFRHLEHLRLCRYRAERGEEPQAPAGCASRVAETLAPLSKLRILQIHLDVLRAPRVRRRMRGSSTYEEEDIHFYKTELRVLAEVMAQALAPSVQTIAMLMPAMYSLYHGPVWDEFHVVRRSKVSSGSASGLSSACDFELIIGAANKEYWYLDGIDQGRWNY